MDEAEIVLYRPGAFNLQTILDAAGRCRYSGRPAAEIMAEDPALIKTRLGDALIYINDALARELVKPWERIDVYQWRDLLGILPPINWQNVDGVEFFQVPEPTAGDFTTTAARFGEKYFAAQRRIGADYRPMAKEIKAADAEIGGGANG